MEGYKKYNDGWHGGKRLFESQANRGVFLPLKELHPNKRFANYGAQELPNCKLCVLSQLRRIYNVLCNFLHRT